jgi:uncharacterized protein with von Willebrand factor type A (vWA) domain
VFAFGTRLTDLSASFRQADTDAMLLEAGAHRGLCRRHAPG